jgi:GH24 family phage-related lysozyme (muramidase)
MTAYHSLPHFDNEEAQKSKVLQYLKQFEGFSPKKYEDPPGQPAYEDDGVTPHKKTYSIGYGHQITNDKQMNETWDEAKAWNQLQQDYKVRRAIGRDYLAKYGVTNASGRLLDAIGLTIFNAGDAWLHSKKTKPAVKAMIAGDEDPMIERMREIATVGGKWDAGIQNRRNVEAKYARGVELPTSTSPKERRDVSRPAKRVGVVEDDDPLDDIMFGRRSDWATRRYSAIVAKHRALYNSAIEFNEKDTPEERAMKITKQVNDPRRQALQADTLDMIKDALGVEGETPEEVGYSFLAKPVESLGGGSSGGENSIAGILDRYRSMSDEAGK